MKSILLHEQYSYPVSLTLTNNNSAVCACDNGEVYKLNVKSLDFVLLGQIKPRIFWLDVSADEKFAVWCRADENGKKIFIEYSHFDTLEVIKSIDLLDCLGTVVSLKKQRVWYNKGYDGIALIDFESGTIQTLENVENVKAIGPDIFSEDIFIAEIKDSSSLLKKINSQTLTDELLIKFPFMDIRKIMAMGNKIVCSRISGELFCWDRISQGILWEIKLSGREMYSGLASELNCLIMYGSDYEIVLINLDSGKIIETINTRGILPKGIVYAGGHILAIDSKSPKVHKYVVSSIRKPLCNRFYFFCFFAIIWVLIALPLYAVDSFWRKESFVSWHSVLLPMLAIVRALSLAFYTASDSLSFDKLARKKILIGSFMVAVFDLAMTILIPLAFVLLLERGLPDKLAESFEMVFVVVLFMIVIYGPLYPDKLLMHKLFETPSKTDPL